MKSPKEVIGKACAVVNVLVNEQVRLTEVRSSDKSALVEQLNDTDTSAEEWLAIFAKATQQQGRPVNWAIRNAEDYLIGLAGHAVLGPGDDDGSGSESLPVRLRGVRSGQNHRPGS